VTERSEPVVVVGAGFTGLAAAYELATAGHRVTVLERDAEVGGLASGFKVGEATLERFYHHWFTNDVEVQGLIQEIGESERVIYRPTRTGMYYANSIFRLSTPVDLLKFTALSLPGRIRLGLLALRARGVRDWRAIEHLTAREWLMRLAGPEVFRVVWEPLLIGKFGPYADRVGAVWFWKKLVLRGGSRAADGREVLAYYRGGFCELAAALQRRLRNMGVEFQMETAAVGLEKRGGDAVAVRTRHGRVPASAVLLTQPLPLIADVLEGAAPAEYVESLRRIEYLANLCLVLELDRSLSETYWLNVNDPTFPFVGVIEHTNFEPPASYGGRHIVYLSKYLPEADSLFSLSDDDLLEFALPHLQRMFPNFSRDWVRRHHVWRARHSQPVVEPGYSRLIPPNETPLGNVLVASMAQIYPEDRGTNYAVREGRRAGRLLAQRLRQGAVAVAAEGEVGAAPSPLPPTAMGRPSRAGEVPSEA
jgi:protoporphyrinogen oxidase